MALLLPLLYHFNHSKDANSNKIRFQSQNLRFKNFELQKKETYAVNRGFVLSVLNVCKALFGVRELLRLIRGCSKLGLYCILYNFHQSE